MTSLHRPGRLAAAIAAICLALFSAGARADEMRTWTDATGKHKLKAAFVSLDDGKVTLEKAGGGEIEIELKKLSKIDQKYVADVMADAGDNPFAAKDSSPFESKPKRMSRSARSTADDDLGGDGEPRNRARRLFVSRTDQPGKHREVGSRRAGGRRVFQQTEVGSIAEENELF